MSEYPLISVIIPTIGVTSAARRVGLTVSSLAHGTLQPDEYIIIRDTARKGASWARNEGASRAKGKYILFSDDDIVWTPKALQTLCRALESDPGPSFSYGWWKKDGISAPYSKRPWDAERLLENNYISTMSLIRRKDFPGFDVSIKRLQDWDVWVTLVKQGKYGVFCDTLIFTTKEARDGITKNGISWEKAAEIVRKKHGI